MDYTTLAPTETVERTIAALMDHNIRGEFVPDGAAALIRIQELIPAGASVMNGASVTLETIGYTQYLKSGKHPWRNLHAEVNAENDPKKRAAKRRQAAISDYYLGSAHAVTQTGELLFASNTGSQLPHLAYTSPNIILVVGTHKIVPAIADGLKRIEEYILPLEDKHMLSLYNVHTMYAKTLILRRENPSGGRLIRVIFVNEVLGF